VNRRRYIYTICIGKAKESSSSNSSCCQTKGLFSSSSNGRREQMNLRLVFLPTSLSDHKKNSSARNDTKSMKLVEEIKKL
jgi:hypothetical protein